MNRNYLLSLIICAVIFVGLTRVSIPDPEKFYWEPNNRTSEERHALNWIFESTGFAHDQEVADVQMSTYASLMGFDYMGSNKYSEKVGVLPHSYWAANSMYGDWWEDPREVCLRANLNEDFPGFIAWRFSTDADPSTMLESDKWIYFDGQFLNFWIDCQRDSVIDMYIEAMSMNPGEEIGWEDIGIIYIDEFTAGGYAYITEDNVLVDGGNDVEFRCHEFHEEGGVDGLGHDYSTVAEGKLVMLARLLDLAHSHGIKVAVGAGGTEWFNEYLPYINGLKPANEWPYEIPLERYIAAEPDYLVIEPDLGDPGTQQFEWSIPDYTAAEPWAERVYAGSPRPHIPEIGTDSEANVYTVGQVIFRAGYLADKGFWFGPNSESMDAVMMDPDLERKTAVKPFLKAIPNWENLNNIPVADRTFDMDTHVYESPNTRIDQEIIYSIHPFTRDIHVVFLEGDAGFAFNESLSDYHIYQTTPLWEREEEKPTALVSDGGIVSLSDQTMTNTGYVLSKNEYVTIVSINQGHRLYNFIESAIPGLRLVALLGMAVSITLLGKPLVMRNSKKQAS